MDQKFIPYVPVSKDLEQMPDTPTRGAHHRRAQSESFFRFADLDDIMIDNVDLNFDLFPNPSVPQMPENSHESRPPTHLRSISVEAYFFEGLMLDEPAEVGPGKRHRHSNSIDGYSSVTSSEVDSLAKKAMAADKLAELSLIDPKRAKRILANRQSVARSKERKVRYTSELERKVQTLQTEATTLSAQITLLQRNTTGLTAEKKELKLKLEALVQQAHLIEALNEALRDEVQRLKIEAGIIPVINGNNRGLSSSRSPKFHYFGNEQAQQPVFQQDFNRRN